MREWKESGVFLSFHKSIEKLVGDSGCYLIRSRSKQLQLN